MWGSFFLAAWRNLGRNRIHGALTIISLSLALGVVILLGLVVRNEWRFDRTVPGVDKTYLLVLTGTLPAGEPFTTANVPLDAAGRLVSDFRGVTTVARMIYGDTRIATVDGKPVAPARFGFRAAQVETAVVDPAFFTVLPLPVLHGDLAAAVRGADTIVVTESLALAYFHRTDVIGRRLSIVLLGSDFPPMSGRVGAVLRDLPPESHLNTRLFITGGLAAERFARWAASDGCRDCIGDGVTTYVRLKPGVTPPAAGRWLDRQVTTNPDWATGMRGSHARFALVPVADLHRRTDIQLQTYTVGPGLFVAVCGFAGLVAIMAGGNFILLMIGHGASRGLEIGVRAALGARRRDLVLQLVAEAVLYALAGIVLAMAMVEQALPFVDRAIGRTIAVDGWRDGFILLGLFGLLCAVGVGAGIGPALILAARPPAGLLRGPLSAQQRVPGLGYARSGLVAVQVTMLTTLLLVSVVFYRQIALEETFRGMDARHVLVIVNPPGDAVPRIAHLPGVLAVGQSMPNALFGRPANISVQTPRGLRSSAVFGAVDAGFFEVYGIRPVVGNLDAPPPSEGRPGRVILNLSAVRAFGLDSPARAIGQTLRFTGRDDVTMEVDVVAGVVPDTSLNGTANSLPAAWHIQSGQPGWLSIKARPGAEASVEQSVEALWANSNYGQMDGFSIADWQQATMAPIQRLARLLAAITVVGGVIALVGLFQLSSYTVRRRACEIAVRQAFGAPPLQSVRRTVWDQMPPILLAVVLAWPVATALTAPWLHTFAQAVAVGPVTVLAVGAAVLGLAWLTTGLHVWRAIHAWPGPALRYE